MSKQNDEAPVGNPINDFSFFAKHWIEIKCNRGKRQEKVITDTVRILKTTVTKAQRQGLVLDYHEDDLLTNLQEILTEVQRTNVILERQLSQMERDEELRKDNYEDNQ